MARWLANKGKASRDLDEPEPIFDDLYPIWHAWHDLNTSRPIAGGMVPMPLALSWSELSRYCEDHGIAGESRRRWIRLLRAMDVAYLGVIAEGRAARRRSGNP